MAGLRPPPFFVGDDLALDFLNSVAAPWGEQIEWLASVISDECAKPLTQLARLSRYGVKRTLLYALVKLRQHARRSRMGLFEPRDQVAAAR